MILAGFASCSRTSESSAAFAPASLADIVKFDVMAKFLVLVA